MMLRAGDPLQVTATGPIYAAAAETALLHEHYCSQISNCISEPLRSNCWHRLIPVAAPESTGGDAIWEQQLICFMASPHTGFVCNKGGGRRWGIVPRMESWFPAGFKLRSDVTFAWTYDCRAFMEINKTSCINLNWNINLRQIRAVGSGSNTCWCCRSSLCRSTAKVSDTHQLLQQH